jgi:hypothetical protein
MDDRAAESIWTDLVAAERRAVELRAELSRMPDRNSVIAASLGQHAGGWNQRAALNYLFIFVNDIAENVPELFDLSMNGKMGLQPIDVLAKGERSAVLRQVRDAAAARHMVDSTDYATLAAVLSRLGARDDLVLLISAALRSTDAETRDVGQYLAERHGVGPGNASDRPA